MRGLCRAAGWNAEGASKGNKRSGLWGPGREYDVSYVVVGKYRYVGVKWRLRKGGGRDQRQRKKERKKR